MISDNMQAMRKVGNRIDNERHLVGQFQHGTKGVHVANPVDLAKGYERGDFHIQVSVMPAGSDREHHFIFCAVPSGREAKTREAAEAGMPEMVASCEGGNGQNDFVFMGITEFVKSPKDVIASCVWSVAHEQVKYRLGDLLGPSLTQTIRIGKGVAKREFGIAAPGAFASARKRSLIECSSEAVQSIESDTAHVVRNGFDQFDLVDILQCFCIALDDLGVWITVKEGILRQFERLDVSFCMFEAVERAGKGICHAQTLNEPIKAH